MLKKLRANLPKYKNLLFYYSSAYWDQLLFKWAFSKNKIKRAEGLSTILLFTEDPRIDIIRFFQVLKSSQPANYILLINHSKLDPLFKEAGFDQIIYYRNLWDFRRKLKNLPPISLAHGFTRRCHLSEILLKEQDIPVILSVKDTSVCSHGINPPHWYLKEELPSEKYSFEHAHGLIAESLEPCQAFRLFQINKKHPRIYFPNYCEASKNVESTKKLSDNELHLVYVGSIRGSQDDPKEHGNIQMHWLINSLNEQKIHFHVYPNPNMSRVVYDEYYEMDKNLPYFHMHESLKPAELTKEIAQYHYGLIPFFNEDTNRSPMKRYYSASLKIFNYVEAGLPILISNDMGHQRWLFQRYGIALGMDKKDFYQLENRLGGIQYEELIANLMEKRKVLTLENQINRVIDFYSKCLDNA